MERKALDLTRYVHDEVFNLQALNSDLAGLALEAGNGLSPVNRINYLRFEAQPEGKVTCPELDDRDITEHFSVKTEFDEKETSVGTQFKNKLLESPPRTTLVWFSPSGGPENYEHAEIGVGFNSIIGNTKIMDVYYLPSLSFTPNQMLLMSWRTAEFSNQNYRNLKIPSDLRETVIEIPPQSNIESLDLLRELIPLNGHWNAIESEQAKRNKVEALADTGQVISQIKPFLSPDLSRDEFLQIGAQAEQLMSKIGRGISSGSCGILNSDLLSQNVNYFYRQFSFQKDGLVLVHSKKGWVYEPGYCRDCKDHKKMVGPCNICSDCEKKYD